MMKVSEQIDSGVFIEFTYENERLSVTVMSEKSGSTTFSVSEECTDRLKAMLFVLDEDLQQAKERQSKKSLNRSRWDEAKRKNQACSWKAQEIYMRLKAERKEIEQELARAGTCEAKKNYSLNTKNHDRPRKN